VKRKKIGEKGAVGPQLSEEIQTALDEAQRLAKLRAEVGRLPEGAMKESISKAIDKFFAEPSDLCLTAKELEERIELIVYRKVDQDLVAAKFIQALFEPRRDAPAVGKSLVDFLEAAGFKRK